jgi:hypothetical protein
MKTINRILLFYFIFALPFLFVMLIVWPNFARTDLATGSEFLKWGNAVTGLMIAVWMISALYIALSLVVSRRFREQLLKKFVRMRERDEREEMVVGRSARNAFLFNIALLILLFMLNLIQVQVTKLAPDHMIDGKGHNLSLGLNASPVEQPSKDRSAEVREGDAVVFEYDFPVTVSGIIMILIIANVGYFFICARRFERKDMASKSQHV